MLLKSREGANAISDESRNQGEGEGKGKGRFSQPDLVSSDIETNWELIARLPLLIQQIGTLRASL